MFKRTTVFVAAVMAVMMLAAGCGKAEKSSITMDTSNEKAAVIELSNAKEDEFVQGGYISVADGEGIEVVSDLNDGGKVLISFIAVEENQSMDETLGRPCRTYNRQLVSFGFLWTDIHASAKDEYSILDHFWRFGIFILCRLFPYGSCHKQIQV